jgi:hypothetical protein
VSHSCLFITRNLGKLAGAFRHNRRGRSLGNGRGIFLSFFGSFTESSKHVHDLLIRDVRLVRFGIDEKGRNCPALQVIDQPKAKAFAAANVSAVYTKLPDYTMPFRNRTSRFRMLLQGIKGWVDRCRDTRIALGQSSERRQKARSLVDLIG